MNPDDARKWLVTASLIITGALFLFFILAPAFHYPLQFKQARSLLEVLLPVFLGYLGSAAHFLFRVEGAPQVVRSVQSPALLTLLLKGPVVIFTIAVTAALIAFGVMNRSGQNDGGGMTIQDLSGILSLALGLLTITTSVLSAYLFPAGTKVEHA